MGIAVVGKKVPQALLACKVEEGEVVENKTWREVFVPALIPQDFTTGSLSPFKILLAISVYIIRWRRRRRRSKRRIHTTALFFITKKPTHPLDPPCPDLVLHFIVSVLIRLTDYRFYLKDPDQIIRPTYH